MNLQNLAYALDQAVHNLGAVAVTAGAVAALFSKERRRFAWLVLSGWGLQAVTGALFGIISHAFYGRLPDIGGIALAALLVKMGCAATGFLLAALYLRKSASWSDRARNGAWHALATLAFVAISAAAFLRWFS